MALTVESILSMSPEERDTLLRSDDVSVEDLEALTREYLEGTARERQENALTYYVPVSDKSRKIHESSHSTIAAFGGNRSGKTELFLVEAVIQATGIIPDSLRHNYPIEKLAPGRKFRIVLENLTTHLETIILPKLQWWHWEGVGQPGSEQGHWGWIPRRCLVNGDWEQSWDRKNRTLKLVSKDKMSLIQFMSKDQDPSDFSSGSFWFIYHDEPTKWAIWRENSLRVADVGGRLGLGMTFPDEPGMDDVTWIYDEIYEQGMEGSPRRDPKVLCVNLHTEENQNVNLEAIMERVAKLSPEQREVRLHGTPMQFSRRIHPLFTDMTRLWCFECNTSSHAAVEGRCQLCGGSNVEEFSHVQDFDHNPSHPVVFCLDPHPSRPHMMQWVAFTPHDEARLVCVEEVQGEGDELAEAIFGWESRLNLRTAYRLIDPNMGTSPSGKNRGVTWQEYFSECGIVCDLADDDRNVGISRVNERLKPDPRTRAPGFIMHPRCERASFQMKRYIFGEWARYGTGERNPKNVPKDINDDHPTMLRYIFNANPSFDGLIHIGHGYHAEGAGRHARTGY